MYLSQCKNKEEERRAGEKKQGWKNQDIEKESSFQKHVHSLFGSVVDVTCAVSTVKRRRRGIGEYIQRAKSTPLQRWYAGPSHMISRT